MRQTEIGRWLADAEAAVAARDWSVAADRLRSVLALDPSHSEAAARLVLVREQAARQVRPMIGEAPAGVRVSRGAAFGICLVIIAGAAASMALGLWAGS